MALPEEDRTGRKPVAAH